MIEDDMVREAQLQACLPNLFLYKTLFYVGAYVGRMQMLPLFIEAGYKIDILEAFEPNYQGLLEFNAAGPVFRKIICGDIRTHRAPNFYDVVMWWHGPEHVNLDELTKAREYLESIAKQYVVLACPWGVFEQPPEPNPFEEHLLALYPSDFESWGYETDTIGWPNIPGSNLIAWKRMSE